MFAKLSRLVAGLAILVTVGCGSASTYGNCVALCDAFRRCNYTSDVDHQNCVNSCNDNKGKATDLDTQLAKTCSNSGDILAKQHDCYTDTQCLANGALFTGQVTACVTSASQCVSK